MVRRVLMLLVIAGLLAGCAAFERPIRPRPTVGPMLTRVPAPIPWPTVSPEEKPLTSVQTPAWGLRSVSAPDAPVLLVYPHSQVINLICVGDCVVGGGPSWFSTDARVGWTHPDPLSVDEYEVWKATDEPYFDPESCAGCELAATTTGLAAVIAGSPPGFNPVGGSDQANIMSRIDTYVVRAVNGGGVSELSNEIGVVNYSLLQGFTTLDK